MTKGDAAGRDAISRRGFLERTGALAAGVLAASSASIGPTLLGRARRKSPIKHVIVSCQENHAFDHWFGSYEGLPAGYGIPNGWENSGIAPFHFTNLTGNNVDPYHGWAPTRAAYAEGAMTGFVSNGSGRDAMGYYTGADLPYYYSLLSEYTLCAEYFCGVLSDTLPNRMVLYAGTTGGVTTATAPKSGTLTWPCITHLLADAGISYKSYNFHAAKNTSVLSLWKGNTGASMNQTSKQFFKDCKDGTLPHVSWIQTQPPYDEHPPENVQTGETLMSQIFEAVQASRLWESTAILHTYDEGGGYFDHRPPRELDAYGSGIRVPMLVISPHARKGHVDTTYSDHASVLKFIEHVFGLPTLASVNHRFDRTTPSNGGQGGGQPFPPRDGNAAISNLTQCFNVEV